MNESRCASHALRAGVGIGVLIALASAVGCSQTDDRPFAWGYLSPVIFQPSCATSACHSRAVAVAGLDFSSPDRGYASLTAGTVWVSGTGTQAAQAAQAGDGGCREIEGLIRCPSARALVVPYDPAQSRVVNMLRARAAPRMPPDRPLPEADIRLIERWILDGARRHPDEDASPPLAPIFDGATTEDDGAVVGNGDGGPAGDTTDGASDASTAGH